jgi:predicted acyltransferase
MTAARPRSLALDVFRGATVALMILVNNPGSWDHLYPPLAHAPWHGCTATDLVFPFFLFAVGNALALVMPRLLAARPADFAAAVARRTLLIFVLGLLLNAFPFVRWDAFGDLVSRDWSRLRVMGVLQRIAIAWCLAVLLLRLLDARVKPVLMVTAALLLGYWWLCVALGAPGDPYSLEGYFGTALDRALLGPAHLYRGEGVPFDPEGLAGTLPAVAQVLLGWWVGDRLREHGSAAPQLLRLFVTATLLLALAHAWQWAMPLNKKLWTSPYVLHTTALAMLTLGLLLPALDTRGGAAPRRWWTGAVAQASHCCAVFGRNPLFIFVLSGLVPRALGLLRWADGVDDQGAPRFITPLPWLYRSVFADLGRDPRLGSLLFALANLGVYWALARGLDRRGIYFKV